MAEKAKTTTTTTTTTKAGTLVPEPPKKVFPPLDSSTFASQLFWLAIAFGLLYYLMSKVALPRIGSVIDERADRIKRDLDEATRLKDETTKALASYEQAMAEARTKAQTIAKEARDRLTAEVEKERLRVDQQIATKVAETEKRIAATKATALSRVSEIATETAGAIVTRMIGTEVSVDEIQRAIASANRT